MRRQLRFGFVFVGYLWLIAATVSFLLAPIAGSVERWYRGEPFDLVVVPAFGIGVGLWFLLERYRRAIKDG